jgi:integrase
MAAVDSAIDQFLDERRKQGAAANTLSSYQYDLRLLQRSCTATNLRSITAEDISKFLISANAPATRKRRLTSLRALMRWATTENLITSDPIAGFDQVRFARADPLVLTEDEEIALVFAAGSDAGWSELAIHLMLHCGMGRNDLLLLNRGDIQMVNSGTQIRVVDDLKPSSPVNRTLIVSPYLFDLYNAWRERAANGDRIFPVGPPAINGMVSRVRRRAGIGWNVTPRTLRDTCTVNLARSGLSAGEIVHYLGMVDESRNRNTVQSLIDRHALI